jgi:hypothetical protein
MAQEPSVCQAVVTARRAACVLLFPLAKFPFKTDEFAFPITASQHSGFADG